MERALNLERLRAALGEGGMFPSAEELQRRLAAAEIALFIQRGSVDDDLLATAWYLHGVGTARVSFDLYPVERQLRANQVAAHIFDLALSAGAPSQAEQREMTFAAQVSYLRGDLDPNALALYRRLPSSEPRLRDEPGQVSLSVGSAVLALDRHGLFSGRFEALRREANWLARIVGVTDLINTPYGSAARVIEGCYELVVHLTYNRPVRLERARQLFEQGINPPYARADLDSRWVAAHLRDIADDLGSASVWAHLPPSVPPAAAQAMTLGDPPVLSLWPPQLDLLSGTPNPLDPAVRRLVLSFPTSAGKTLIAQYIIAAHVASGAGSACVVVPTHSLARELRRDLDRRLSTIARRAEDAGPLGLPLPEPPSAVVMTPEKLAAHLRLEPRRMLEEYSLFVIDEAHLVGDAERGWVLESALGFLHETTLRSNHRIVLLSAALGNRVHVAAWMGIDGVPAQLFHQDWRGPRRAHALFGTTADRTKAEAIPSRKGALPRERWPLHGEIHVQTAPGRHQSLRTTEPIGSLVVVRRDGIWKKDATKSEPAYRIRARMATILGGHGQVLIIEPTKQAAQRTAIALAEEIESDDPECGSLVALAATRLDPAHPLVGVLRRGVGFHHAALPGDMQSELEDGIRKGPLRYLVATTTLIEGINFPVRSVLVGDRGYPTADGFVTTLDAPRLLNAAGRAGRAGRETEGWIVLSLNKQFSPHDFVPLSADDEDLTAASRLSTGDALEALAAFEEMVRQGQDAIMQIADGAAADFVAHVWFVANGLSELERATADPAQLSIESTLAWQQLDDRTRERWRCVSALAVRRFEETPTEVRKRWARAGTSLPSAVLLQQLATEVRAERWSLSDPRNPVSAFLLVSDSGRLRQLLSINETHAARFRPRRNAPRRTAFDVDLRALIVDWLHGREVGEIGDAYLGAVTDETYRYEQLSEFIAQVLEHLLPWLLNTLVGWVNEGLEEDEQLCPELPAYVRFGVDNPVALELAKAGVRSRRLIHAVVAAAATEPPVREWLAETDIRTWRQRFDASPSELSDLLVFSRAQDARITSRVLAGEIVEVPLRAVGSPMPGEVQVRAADEDPPPRLVALRDGQVIGYVPALTTKT
ncbi:MAG: DEAD/DEAH box helicase [Micromonosporaceae bacterium]|nr:DEAD/DEAH box helicase [Micromonosporaceae bacterium]